MHLEASERAVSSAPSDLTYLNDRASVAMLRTCQWLLEAQHA